MNPFKRIQTAMTDYAVGNADRARRPPRFKLARVVLILIAASYMLYYVSLTRGGLLAKMASIVLVVMPMMELMTDFTRYLYIRGRRSANSVRGDRLR